MTYTVSSGTLNPTQLNYWNHSSETMLLVRISAILTDVAVCFQEVTEGFCSQSSFFSRLPWPSIALTVFSLGAMLFSVWRTVSSVYSPHVICTDGMLLFTTLIMVHWRVDPVNNVYFPCAPSEAANDCIDVKTFVTFLLFIQTRFWRFYSVNIFCF